MKKKDQQFYLVDLKILPEAIKKCFRTGLADLLMKP